MNNVLCTETKLLILRHFQDLYGNCDSKRDYLKIAFKHLFILWIYHVWNICISGIFMGLHIFMRIKNVFQQNDSLKHAVGLHKLCAI